MEKIILELFNKNIPIIYAIIAFIFLIIFIPIISKLASEDLTSLLRKYIELLKYIYARKFSPTKFQQITLFRYFRRIVDSDLFKVSIPTYEDYITKKLKDVFIPLNLLDTKKAKSHKIHGNKLRETNQYSLIIGEPGGGKTTLVKSILLTMVENSLSSRKIDKIPVFVPLKDIQLISENDNNSPIESYIKNNLLSFGIPSLIDIYEKATTSFGCIFVFDGMDEISNQKYKQVEQYLLAFINDIKKKSEKNEIYITAREQFYKSEIPNRRELNTLFPQIASIVPFKDEEVYQFLRKWKDFKEGQLASQLFSELILRPHVLDLCRNPLLLSILTAQYSSRAYFEIPESRSAFYNAISKELLYRRRGFKDSIRTSKHLVEERSRFLKQIAYNNMFCKTSRNSFSKGELLEAIDNRNQEKEEFLNSLCIDTGLLKMESSDKYTFMHLSFEEFYAAEYIEEKESWELLFNNFIHSDERLEEIITFFIGQTKREETINKVLNDLFEAQKIDLLLKCFLEKKCYRNNVFDRLIEHILTDLTKMLKTENNIRNTTFINFVSVIFDSKEMTGNFPKGFEQKLIELVRNDEKYLVEILYLVGKYDPKTMLSIYQVFGEKYLDQLLDVLKLLLSDERIVDDIIEWYNQNDPFIPKENLILILINGMKFPSTRKILAEQRTIILKHKADSSFVIPNYNEDSALALIFNLGLSISKKNDKQKYSEELNFAINLKDERKLLKQWNSFFKGSRSVTNEHIDFIRFISKENFLSTISITMGRFGLYNLIFFILIQIYVALSDYLDFTSFIPAIYLGPLISISFLLIISYAFSTTKIQNLNIPQEYSSKDKMSLWKKILSLYASGYYTLKNIRNTIPHYSINSSKSLFKKLEKLESQNSLSNVWFFDV